MPRTFGAARRKPQHVSVPQAQDIGGKHMSHCACVQYETASAHVQPFRLRNAADDRID